MKRSSLILVEIVAIPDAKFTNIGKKHISAAIAIFEDTPMPNSKTNSGARVIIGIT